MSSRLLIFVLTLVALATGGANLYLSGPDAVRTAHAHLDAQLGRAAKALPAVVSSGTQRNLGLVADIARVPSLQAAITDTAQQKRRPDQQLLDLARETLEGRAETRGDVDRNAALLVVATAGGSAEYRLEGGSEFNQEPGVPLVREALDGNTTHALASLGGEFYRLAAVPVGMSEKPLGAVAVGYRVDDRFVEGLRDTLGVDVTLIKGGEIVATSVPAESRAALVEGLVGGGGVFGFEELPPNFSLFGVLNLPLSLEPIHAGRGQTVRVAGIEGAEVVLSTPATTGLIPIADGQKRTVLFSGVVLVLGLLFTVLAGGRGSSYDGEEIASLADDVERMVAGDSATRATEYLPGDLGRLARGINKLGGRLVAATASLPQSGTLGHTPGPAKSPGFSFEGENEPSATAENPALDDEPAFTAAGADPSSASAGPDDEGRDEDFSDIPAWARPDSNQDAADGFSFGGADDTTGSLAAFEDSLLGGSSERDSEGAPDSLAAAASAAAADLDAFASTAGPQADAASNPGSEEGMQKAAAATWGSDPFEDAATEPAYQAPEPSGSQPTAAGQQGSLHTGAPLAWELPSAGPGAQAGDELKEYAGEGAAAGGSEADFSSLLDPTAGPSRTSTGANPAAGLDPFVEALREAGRSEDRSGNQAFNPDATMIAAVPEALLRATSRSMAPEPAPAPAAVPPMASSRSWQPPQQSVKPAVSTPVFAALQEDEDEAHFRQVFQDFLDTRESCGEPATNLTYERFAAKLHTNREQLIAKYQCRTVRFTVYVKEGKAALKAAPIRA